MHRLSNQVPTVFGVGYTGSGDFDSKSPEYRIWKNMLSRCYYDNHQQAYNQDAKVCDDWLNYQNFANWCKNTRPSSTHELDKDLSGTTIYSPETCNWLPSRINSLINIKRKKASGLPAGVLKEKNKFRARCSDTVGVQRSLGYFDSPEEAFVAYWTFKKSILIELANKYFEQGLITERVKNLLHSFTPENFTQ